MGKICQRSTMRVSVASALLCACACNAFVPGRAPRVRVISPLLAKKDKGGGDDAVAEVQAVGRDKQAGCLIAPAAVANCRVVSAGNPSRLLKAPIADYTSG